MRHTGILIMLGLLLAAGSCGKTLESTSAVRVPPGFKAKDGTMPEPYSKTGWAKEIVHDMTGIEMVFIPAGEFMMGSPAGEKDRWDEEGPVHRVRITKPFYLGKYEVMRGQFAVFVNDTNYRTDAEKEGWAYYAWDGKSLGKVDGASWRKVGFAQADDHPVVCVSYNDAAAFCGWLSRQAGSAAVLPTEAQWEYACRGGTRTAHPWGDDPDDGRGWCNAVDQTAERQFPAWTTVFWGFNWDDGFVFTSPVGYYKANAFGLHDMLGNVWEWCSDWYGEKYYGESPGNDPPGPNDGALRVLRGGSWRSNTLNCRSADRVRYSPDRRVSDLGFRLALDLK